MCKLCGACPLALGSIIRPYMTKFWLWLVKFCSMTYPGKWTVPWMPIGTVVTTKLVATTTNIIVKLFTSCWSRPAAKFDLLWTLPLINVNTIAELHIIKIIDGAKLYSTVSIHIQISKRYSLYWRFMVQIFPRCGWSSIPNVISEWKLIVSNIMVTVASNLSPEKKQKYARRK